MYRPFDLKILTPERVFYDGTADVVTISAPDGKYSILAGHQPLITPLEIGTMAYRAGGEWRTVFNSEGFVEVTSDGVMIYAQTCEYPEEIDANRAEAAKRRAEEHLRQQQSLSEYKVSKIALARAMARLQITQSRRK